MYEIPEKLPDHKLTELSKQAHLKSDVDSSVRSQHHTLGKGPLQAAPGNELVALQKIVEELESSIFLASHPVGAIYFTDQSANPGTIHGGTWVAYGAGRVPVGIDATQAEFDTVNETGGDKEVTLLAKHMAGHIHNNGSLSVTSTGSVHTHGVSRGTAAGGSTGRAVQANTTAAADMNTDTAGSSHTHTILGDTGDIVGDQDMPHPNLQPYIVCYMWKRTA